MITEFNSFMKQDKFVNSEVDTCLYRSNKSGSKEITYVLNYGRHTNSLMIIIN